MSSTPGERLHIATTWGTFYLLSCEPLPIMASLHRELLYISVVFHRYYLFLNIIKPSLICSIASHAPVSHPWL